MTYCNAETLERVNCAEENGDAIQRSCALINDEYGYDCQSAVGSECILSNEDGVVATLCAGEATGCVVESTESAICVEGVGLCEGQDEDGALEAAYCAGDRLVVGCTLEQPLAFDCSAFGGRCEGTGCQMPAETPCDDELFFCEEGLICVGADENARGVCLGEMDGG